MIGYLKLNFPAFKFRVKRNGSDICVWDKIRTKWLVLTPEEWVRQHLLLWLVDECGVDSTLISTEHPVLLNGQSQRADVVIFDTNSAPYMLVECKSADVKLDEDVFAQAARYNTVVGAKYMLITNGLEHRCYILNKSSDYSALHSMPTFEL